MTPGCLFLLATVMMLGTASLAAQIPTFKVKTKEVRIDMLVADHGKLVTGLRGIDFEVLDNGVPQKIEFVGFQQTRIDTILVLDMSASVAGAELDHLRAAGTGFLNSLQKDERAALITFGDVISLGSPLSADLTKVKNALDQAKPAGDTSLIDACYAGMMLAISGSSRPLLLVFSDGLDTFSWLSSKMVLESAKRSNVVIYGISVGQLPDQTFLRDLSRVTGGSLFEIESTKDLGSIFLSILDEFRQRYLLTYSPQGVSNKGWHELKIRVKGRNLDIKARPGYQASPANGEEE